MFSSLFEKLKFPGLVRDPFSLPATPGEEEEHEEDGFLLIGQTASDKTIVFGNQKYLTDSPPDYSQVVKGDFISSHSCCTTDKVDSHSVKEKHSYQKNSYEETRHLSPLLGIPFQFSEHLETIFRIQAIDFSSIAATASSVTSHQYDFSFEESLIRDTGRGIPESSFV